MAKEVEVSVIIPNYNYGKYISKCIYSVIESNFDKKNIEIIIVDDASTDDSVNIISSIIEKETFKITLYQNKKNLGLAKTRNKGISLAKGDFLFFLDSDNYISKNCLKDHHDFLSKHTNYSACYAPIQKFDSTSGELLTIFSNQQFDLEKLKHGNYIDAMSMIKKNVFEELGSYDEEMPINGWEDYELWLRIGSNNIKTSIIGKEPLSYYRVHEESMISNFSFADTSIVSDYIDKKYAISIRKNPVQESKVLSSLNEIITQVFYSSKDEIFCEEQSLTQLVELAETPNAFSFSFKSNQSQYEKFRFDFGNKIGVLNIHSIEFKTLNNNTLYTWDKNNISHKSNLFLIQDKNLWGDKLIQVSYFKDPQFSLFTPKSILEQLNQDFKIEITLSKTTTSQINQLDSHVKKLSYISVDEFDEIKLKKEELKNELNNSGNTISQITKDLEHSNLLLNKNNTLITQLLSDKSFLENELKSKNEVVKKIFTEKEKTENTLTETIEKSNKNLSELRELLKNEQKNLQDERENSVIINNKLQQAISDVNELNLETNSLKKEKEILAERIDVKEIDFDEIKGEFNLIKNSLEEKTIKLKNHEEVIKNLNERILEFENKGVLKLIFEKRKKQ